MKKVDQEILLTAMDIVSRLSNKNVNYADSIKSLQFRIFGVPSNIKTAAETTDYIKDTIIPAFYDFVIERFKCLSETFLDEDIYTGEIPKEEVQKIKDIFSAKVDDINNYLADDISSSDLKYLCDFKWLDSANDRITCSHYLLSSLVSVVILLFKDILDIINKKNIDKEKPSTSTLDGSVQVVQPPQAQQQAPIQPMQPQPLVNFVRVNNPTENVEQPSNNIMPNLPYPVSGKEPEINNTESQQQLPAVANNNLPAESDQLQQYGVPIMTIPVVFDQEPLPTLSFDDPVIKKHFIIGPNVIIPDEKSQLQLQFALKVLGEKMDKVEKKVKSKKHLVFGFRNFVSINKFDLVTVNKDGEFYNENDKDNFMQILCTNGSYIFIGKEEYAEQAV